MSLKNQNILNFIQDYYAEYNSLIENYIYNMSGEPKEDSELKEKLFKNLEALKKQIPSKIFEYGLNESDINSDLKNEKQVISLIQDIYKMYDYDITSLESESIFETTMLNIVELNKEDIEQYIVKINNYKNDKIINNLYELTFLNNTKQGNSNNPSLNNDFKSVFTEFFKESLSHLKLSQKAELYSQLNIFIEEYTKTPLGKKHIEIIYEQYLEDVQNNNTQQDKNYAARNYLLNILSAYNACTPTENNVLVDKNEIKLKTAKRGTFDALLFINTTPIPDNRKTEFESITKMEELNKFKASISNISQYQISATADNGFDIESGSVVKHCLSSLVINKILNLHWMIKADDHFIDLFSMKNDNYHNFNQNMKGAITQAIKEMCPELIDVLCKDKKDINDENFFIKIQQEMNKNPLLFIDYLNNKYEPTKQGNDLIRERINLTEQDMSLFDNLEKQYQFLKNRTKIFQNKSLLCLFREEEAYKNVHFDIDCKTKLNVVLRNEIKKQELSTNDVILLIQFNSIVKSSYLGSETADNKSITKIIDNFFDIRGIGLKNKYNNELLKKFKIEDIDQLIIHNFVYSHNSLSNLKKLNKQDMENTVQCIVIYFDSANQEDKIKIFERLKEHSKEVKYLRDSLNKGKSIDKISDITDKINEIKELHKIIEKEREEKLKERKEKEEAYKIIEEKDKKYIIGLIHSVLELEISTAYFYKQLNNNKDLFKVFSTEYIEHIKKDLSVNEALLEGFNTFLKENNLFQINSNDLLNESFNNSTKANKVIEEIKTFMNNSQNKKYKKEEEFGSTTRLENLFASIESKIENKDILEMVKNSIEEDKNNYPQIWKKLSSIDFEPFNQCKKLKNK